jgi:hypothetical protein
MTRIMETPYTEDQLRALSKDGRERIAGVVAVAWHQLVGQDQDAFEEELTKKVTGSRYGLEDLGVKLVGCLGQDVFLEVSGLVGLLIENYAEWMADEAGEGGYGHGA